MRLENHAHSTAPKSTKNSQTGNFEIKKREISISKSLKTGVKKDENEENNNKNKPIKEIKNNKEEKHDIKKIKPSKDIKPIEPKLKHEKAKMEEHKVNHSGKKEFKKPSDKKIASKVEKVNKEFTN